MATSKDVAAYFEKRHDAVLRSIKDMISSVSECAHNFVETLHKTPMPKGGGRYEPAFEMTRDGFTLLAMGFTGKKALQFKLA